MKQIFPLVSFSCSVMQYMMLKCRFFWLNHKLRFCGSLSAEEGPPPQTDLAYYSYEYDPDPYASEGDVFEVVAELTTASTLKEEDKIREVVTTVEW